MAHQKINYTLIFLLGLLIISGCRRESKQETVARWVIINPVTNAPYVGVPVRLMLDDYGGSNPKTEIIWEGKTNSNGIAEYTFNAYKNNRFGYSEVANLAYLGQNGVDYSVIKRPAMSRYTVAKDEVNELRYEIVPYAYLKQIIKNVNCEGSEDILNMHMFLLNVDSGINQEYVREGCYEYETTVSLDGSPEGYRRVFSGTYIYDYEVVRQSGVTYGRDSITLNAGEFGTIEVLY